MRVEVLCSGDELLSGVLADTNTRDLAALLLDAGVELTRSTTVGDDEDDIVEALREVCARADVVICSGGLGPTDDDRTVAAVARAVGAPLVLDEEALRRLSVRLVAAGRTVGENNRKQAMLPEGARVLQSDVGTAPGLAIRIGGAMAYVVPGVPKEARWFCTTYILPDLLAQSRIVVRTATLRCIGIAESELDARMSGLRERHAGISVHFRTSYPENHLKLVARGTEAAVVESVLAAAVEEACSRLGACVFSADGRTLAALIRDELIARNQTLSAAESCTGGWIMKALTDEPGSSRAFKGGVVAYDNRVKVAQLGVDSGTLAREGAVSSVVAEQLAAGVRSRLGTDWALAVTGIAGPEGGTPPKPVGLVYIGLASPSGASSHRRVLLTGDRERIRLGTVATALHWLLDEIRKT